MSNLSKDPRITFAVIRLQDLNEEMQQFPKLDYAHIVANKERVLKRYQPVFNLEHLMQLSEAEFISFLDYKNNCHWTDLHRVRKYIIEDMELLRRALLILLDETRPIQDRLNEIRPQRSWADELDGVTFRDACSDWYPIGCLSRSIWGLEQYLRCRNAHCEVMGSKLGK